jgi:hypothetical protein
MSIWAFHPSHGQSPKGQCDSNLGTFTSPHHMIERLNARSVAFKDLLRVSQEGTEEDDLESHFRLSPMPSGILPLPRKAPLSSASLMLTVQGHNFSVNETHPRLAIGNCPIEFSLAVESADGICPVCQIETGPMHEVANEVSQHCPIQSPPLTRSTVPTVPQHIQMYNAMSDSTQCAANRILATIERKLECFCMVEAMSLRNALLPPVRREHVVHIIIIHVTVEKGLHSDDRVRLVHLGPMPVLHSEGHHQT